MIAYKKSASLQLYTQMAAIRITMVCHQLCSPKGSYSLVTHPSLVPPSSRLFLFLICVFAFYVRGQ